jgi:spore germination protein YaaH
VKKKLLVIVLGLLGVLMAAGGFWWLKTSDGELLNPLGLINWREKEENKLEVMGFLPTWMVGKTLVYGEEIDRLVFLGIEVDEDGGLVWELQSNKVNSENYMVIFEEIKRRGNKNILGIKQFDYNKLNILLADDEARKRAVGEIKELVEEKGFDGVNVDFEFQGDPLAVLEEEMGLFLDELREAEVGEISLDVFANTVIKGGDENLTKLMGRLDHLVVMAYDFHRPGVNFVGPVAPIGSPVGKRNIVEVVEKMVSAGLDKEKMILAYPLYGYEWKTETNEFGAKVIRGWYQMASFRRVAEMIGQSEEINTERQLQVGWDEESMSPWLSFVEDGEIRQIYYEDYESLKIKMDLAKQYGVSGVGFWALGYEGKEPVFWKNMNWLLVKNE